MARYMLGVARLTDERRRQLRADLDARADVTLIEPRREIGEIWLAEMDDAVAQQLRQSEPDLVVEHDAPLH